MSSQMPQYVILCQAPYEYEVLRLNSHFAYYQKFATCERLLDAERVVRAFSESIEANGQHE